MIKNIFLPEKINGYFLFAQRIVGITIGPTHINATQLYIKGKSYIVEKCIQETVDSDTTATATERTIATLKKIKSQLDPFDALHTVLSSSVIVLKELKLPFYDYEKIKMVINFEVEPLLPFAAKDAVIDFIITKQIPEEQSSEILVAAIQKKSLAEHLHLFEQAEMKPQVVTVDLFALYGLYQQIPHYSQQQGSVTLLGLDMHSTSIGHLYNNQLRSIRTMSKGLYSIVKMASDDIKIAPRDVLDHFMRFGLADSDTPLVTDALKKATKLFLNDVSFTLNSFVSLTSQGETIGSLLLFGDGALIHELPLFMNNTMPTPVALFSVQELIDTQKIILKTTSCITSTHLVSLAATLPNAITDNFNVLKNEFSPTRSTLLIKQIGAALLMSVLSLTMLLTYSILETQKMEAEELENKQEAIELLKKEFPKKIEDETGLEEAVEKSTEALKTEEKTWIAFSGKSRTSFLQYWLELTNLVDKEALGFVIDSMGISADTMTIKAHVKDHEALKLLERELRQSKVFSYKEQLTSPIFTMKIMLAQTGGETK
ncbi:MAG: pilus assembly protein PilM [Candidatus Dependentiae bacterium]|nr:pilus assembly protein PilM [Candidatus Dependentiae bacterium]